MEIERIILSTRDLTPEKMGETIWSLRPLITALQRNKMYFQTEPSGYMGQYALPLYDLYNTLIALKEILHEEAYPELIIDEIIGEVENGLYYMDNGDDIDVNGINTRALSFCLLYIRIVDHGQTDPCAQELILLNKHYLNENIEVSDSTLVNDSVEVSINKRSVSLLKYIITLALDERVRQKEEGCADNNQNTNASSDEDFNLLKEQIDCKDKEITELRQKLSDTEQELKAWQELTKREIHSFDDVMEPAGFYEIPMIKKLSRRSKCEFVMKLIMSNIPFKVALLNHIGFMQFMIDEKGYDTQASRLRLLEKALGLSNENRELKGNFNVLKNGTKEDVSKYTSHKHQNDAKEYYESLLDCPN